MKGGREREELKDGRKEGRTWDCGRQEAGEMEREMGRGRWERRGRMGPQLTTPLSIL